MPTLIISSRRVRWLWFGGIGVALVALAWPRSAFAGCQGDGGLMNLPDLGACIDSVQYSGWRGLALWFWQGDQTLLQAAHQVDQLRWFTVERVFLTLYHALVGFLEPLLGPLATLALTLTCLAFILVPVFGEVVFGSPRQIFILLVLLPIAFASAGSWVVAGERLRTEVASDLFQRLPPDLPAELFGQRPPADRDMRAVTRLNFAACGSDGVTVPRTGIGVQDISAALLWADWADIACPQRAGSELPEFPARWSRPAPDGAGWLYPGDLGELNDAHQRAAYIAGAQQALARASWGLIPCALALTEASIQLIFSLCTVVLALAGLLSSVAALFQQRFSGLLVFVQGAWRVVQTSVLTSVLLGFLLLCLLTAAGVGSASACFALAGVTLFVAGCFLVVALLIFKDGVAAGLAGVGLSPALVAPAAAQVKATLQAGGELLGRGAASLTPNLQPAIAGATALGAGASPSYAAGYALGHSRSPLAQVGMLAAVMRGSATSSFTQGVRASMASHHDPLSPRAVGRVRSDVATASHLRPGAPPPPPRPTRPPAPPTPRPPAPPVARPQVVAPLRPSRGTADQALRQRMIARHQTRRSAGGTR